MLIRNLLTLFLTLLLFSLKVNAETNADTLRTKKKFVKYLDFRAENGTMISNGSPIGNKIVESSYYNGFDVRLGFRKTDADDIYCSLYRRPYFGIGAYGSTFNNGDIGKPAALYFFFTLPMAFENNKKLTFSYSAAFGLAYNFNPYHEYKNPANNFIGSYGNCYVHLGFVANYKISDYWSLNATTGLKHFSNGAYKLPNSGINLIPITLGVSKRLNDGNLCPKQGSLPTYKKHDLVNISYSQGSKNYEIGERNYYKSTFSVNYLKQMSYRYRIGLGADIFYSAGGVNRNDTDQSDFEKTVSYAVVGSWEWVLTKNLYAPIGLAYYLHRNFSNGEKQQYYERIGLRYRLSKNLHAGLTIKAHAAVADYFEWTIGYTFHNDPNKY